MKIIKTMGGYFREQYRNYICYLITLGMLALGIFCFPNAIGRLIESCRDLGTSLAYTFCEWFEMDVNITPTVNELPNYHFFNVKEWFTTLFGEKSVPSAPSAPSVPPTPSAPIPSDWELFKMKWSAYWNAFIDTNNIVLYFLYIGYGISWILPIFMFLLPLCIGICKILNKYYFRESKAPETDEERKDETRPITESKYLCLWHRLYFKVIVRIMLWLVSFVEYVKTREEFCRFCLFLVLLYFNVFTIAIEFLAYYVYFMVSMDVIYLYQQVYKLCLDLAAVVSFLPVISTIVMAYSVLSRFGRNVEYEQAERKARGMEEFLRV